MGWVRCCGGSKPYYAPAYVIKDGVIQSGYTFSGSHSYNSGGYQQMDGGIECRSIAIDVRGYSNIDVTMLGGTAGATTVIIDGVSHSCTAAWGIETFNYDVSHANSVVIIWQRVNTSADSRIYNIYMY